MLDSSLVSVVIPTYGRPEYLAAAIGSVAAQTYAPIELVIVDDHSPDATAIKQTIADAPTDTFHAMQFLRHDENRGVSAARNTGIEHATGDFVAFLDDDDEWIPVKLTRQMAVFEDESALVGVVCSGRRSVDASGETIHTRRVTHSGNVTKRLLCGDSVPMPSVVVRQSVLDTVGGFDEELPVYEDTEWLVRASQHCTFRSVGAPLVVSHRGDDHVQLTDSVSIKAGSAYADFMDRCRPIAAEYGVLFERKFLAHRFFQVGYVLLAHGNAASARTYLRNAARTWPFDAKFYIYMFISILGNSWYRRLQTFKRRFV